MFGMYLEMTVHFDCNKLEMKYQNLKQEINNEIY